MAGEVPDYRERLAYGTDQGRWLQEQVNAGGKNTHRRTNSGSRAFHDLDSMHPDPAHTAQAAAALSVSSGADGRFQRVYDGLHKVSSRPNLLALVGVLMVLWCLTRFV